MWPKRTLHGILPAANVLRECKRNIQTSDYLFFMLQRWPIPRRLPKRKDASMEGLHKTIIPFFGSASARRASSRLLQCDTYSLHLQPLTTALADNVRNPVTVAEEVAKDNVHQELQEWVEQQERDDGEHVRFFSFGNHSHDEHVRFFHSGTTLHIPTANHCHFETKCHLMAF